MFKNFRSISMALNTLLLAFFLLVFSSMSYAKTTHDNDVYFQYKSDDGNAQYLSFDLRDYWITGGQPYHGTDQNWDGRGTLHINVKAGRHGSSGPANEFKNRLYQGAAITGYFSEVQEQPGDLNFAVGGYLHINGDSYYIVLGQGHSVVNNNWWIGGKDLTGAQARYLMATTDGKYVIYGKDDNHFEIRKNDTYTDWMSNIDGNRLLSEISMPGTHDSGTYKLHKDSITDTYAVTQDFSILTQLNSGVRVLDIRLGYTDGTLKVFHGSENTHLNFDEVLSQTFDFLNKHPRETVVMLIKHEHDGDIRDHFIDILKSKDSSLNRYWLENRLPNLDEVRNRIVFINRNNDINEGIKISWGDDNIFDSNEGVAFHVQDHYQLNADNTENFKIDKFNDVLNDAINGPENIWYINYLSATYVPIKSLKEIAGQINPKALDKLQNGHPNGRVGSIIMDYVGEKDTPDIIKNVIMRN